MLHVCADPLSIHIHSTHIAHFTNITSPLTLCHFLYIYPPLTLSHLLYALLYAPAALTLSHLSPLLLNAHLTLCHLFYSLYPPLFFCHLYTPVTTHLTCTFGVLTYSSPQVNKAVTDINLQSNRLGPAGAASLAEMLKVRSCFWLPTLYPPYPKS